jgi:hypothetical protein
MIKIIFLLSALCFEMTACNAQKIENQQITRNGMSVSWHIEGGKMHLKLMAPTDGWIAIGFNTNEELAGTNLIMAVVGTDKTTLSDRYIIAAGDHRPVEDLGGKSVVQLASSQEDESGTTVHFSIPLSSSDKFHHTLTVGKTYYLLMAFSQEDDFMHHSIMRTTVKIKL